MKGLASHFGETVEHGTELYNRYLRGDEQALEQLVIEYGDAVACYAYCFVRDLHTAEDVMEDTFATLIVKRKRFAERSPFKAYLFRIARNKCLDRLRKAKREVSLDDGRAFAEYEKRSVSFSFEFKAHLIDDENGIIGLDVRSQTNRLDTRYAIFRYDGNEITKIASVPMRAEDIDYMRAVVIDGYVYVLDANGRGNASDIKVVKIS